MDYSDMFSVPSAPPPPYEEATTTASPACDDTCVAFAVSTDYEHRVIRADRKTMMESNTEFSRLLTSGVFKSTNGQFEIHCKTVSSLELYIRFLETAFVKFPSVAEAQDVLELCIQFPNFELLKRAVSYLDFHISQSNVIPLYRLLKSCNNNISLPSPTKTSCCKAPKANLTTGEHYIAALQENCLQFIDKHSEEVFKQNDMLELRYEELNQILNRSTLELRSELVVIDLLANWSWRQCEKRRMNINDENRRAVLGALCYSPRYLAMPSKQFPQVFDRVHLLDEGEEQLVQNMWKGKKCSNLTTEQVQMIENFRRARPYNKKPRPIHLSDRSHPKKSRRPGTDYYAQKKCSLGDCIYYSLCICFN